MTDEELVERVARKLCRLDDQDPDVFFAEEPFWHLYRYDARAIIPIVQAEQRERDAGIRKQDWQALATQIRMAMAEENLSYRGAAELIGIDQATLHRLAKHGREPSGSTLMLVMGWLERRTAIRKGDA